MTVEDAEGEAILGRVVVALAVCVEGVGVAAISPRTTGRCLPRWVVAAWW